MLNFNFKKLRVVNPKFSMKMKKIIPVSAGADNVIKQSKEIFNF